jgi:superfamily II RNA helicase
MDRSMDSQADARVTFKPDAWQREVLDAVDQNMSLLVVAPTSAGKTFISYYAMEKILRETDDGILVYIAPTKALVAQVAAEIYARFSKELNGRSCWAIHTRDFRVHDPQNCQILVTVPDILAIMLLSPPLAKMWTPRLKYVILDEIHTIGQQEGGAVWEQILLLSPCPVIGLSATVGAPRKVQRMARERSESGRVPAQVRALSPSIFALEEILLQHPREAERYLPKPFNVQDYRKDAISASAVHSFVQRTFSPL